MCKKLLTILLVSILVAATSIGCNGGGGSPCPSTLTVLSITEGDVSVMKEDTDDWVEAEVQMELEVGDRIKTGDDSGAEITFFDGSTMELEAGTEIEILSLDVACDTGVTTITLEQTIGTTISRVTALLDPASSYEIETSTGVAAVRGSVMIVTVGGDGTTLITNQEGNIYAIGQGVKLQIPEGRTGIIVSGQEPELLNDAPVAEDDAATTDEDNPVDVAAPGVLSNDSDPDAGDTLIVTAVDTSGSVGTVTAWDTDGEFTYNPNGQFEYLQAGDWTTDSFTYTVSDSYGGTDSATVTITINGVNDQPVAVNDSATTTENTSVTIDVLNNDSDIDGDTLTVDSVTQGANGSVANNGGNVTYTPAVGFNGTDSFSYIVGDGNGGTSAGTVTVNVTVPAVPATVNVQVDTGPTASVFVWDHTVNQWAVDEDTGEEVDGTNHVTSATINVAGGHDYCVWVGGNVTYYAKNYPSGWSESPLDGGGTAACGYAAPETTCSVHFTSNPK